METRAYAVMWLDVASSPPKYLGVGVYSEPYPTSYSDIIPFEVAHTVGKDYDDACRKLGEAVRGTWVEKELVRRGRR